MLPKQNRADKKTVNSIFKDGKFLNSANLSLKYVIGREEGTQISVIVPKSIARLATKRNALRRLGYQALEKFISQAPRGLQGALVFKKYQDYPQILFHEIETIIRKIN